MSGNFMRNIFYYEDYYLEFYNQLRPEVKDKFNWTLKFHWQRNLKRSIMVKKNSKKLTSFASHLDEQYGKRGTEFREKFESGFEAFKLGIMLQEMRKAKGLTQQELAERFGTSKTYISRIENDASDIRLSTLMRIVQVGLGGHLKVSVDF